MSFTPRQITFSRGSAKKTVTVPPGSALQVSFPQQKIQSLQLKSKNFTHPTFVNANGNNNTNKNCNCGNSLKLAPTPTVPTVPTAAAVAPAKPQSTPLSIINSTLPKKSTPPSQPLQQTTPKTLAVTNVAKVKVAKPLQPAALFMPKPTLALSKPRTPISLTKPVFSYKSPGVTSVTPATPVVQVTHATPVVASNANNANNANNATNAVRAVKDIKVTTQDTAQWGRPTWKRMHQQAAYYSDSPSASEKQHKLDWFEDTLKNLPCRTCKGEAEEYNQNHPVSRAMTNRCTLSKWVLDFHNHVNENLDKKKWTMKEMAAAHDIANVPCE